MITALLLAAGSARRFGAPKLLQDLDGKPVVRWSAETLLAAPIEELIVVAPPDFSGVQHALEGLETRLIVNPHPELEIASSIACGIAAVDARASAVLVALGDEPTMSRRAIDAVLDRYAQKGPTIVVPTYEGVRGHPVLFDRSTFAELRIFSGGQGAGARTVVDRDPSRTAFVELGVPMPSDVDTPADLARLRGRQQFTPATTSATSPP